MTTVIRLGIIALALAGAPRDVAAQITPMSDSAVKGAFLYNFAKFTEWRSSGPDAPLVLCVIEDAAMANALKDTVRAKRIDGHVLEVRQLSNDQQVGSCAIVFVPSSETRSSLAALQAVKRQPVLTVSDGKGFANADGIVEFFAEDGRIRFAINTDAADRAGLHLSSRLLGLARIVRDTDAR